LFRNGPQALTLTQSLQEGSTTIPSHSSPRPAWTARPPPRRSAETLAQSTVPEFEIGNQIPDGCFSASRIIAAAPEYLARDGTPLSPADLIDHQCLGFTHWRHRGGWRLGRPDVDARQVPMSRFECNHGPALRMAALRGFGLVMQPRILVAEDVVAGRLVPVLEGSHPPAMPVHVVCPRDRQLLPKVRTFIDFAVQRFG